jgi:hypothetical protein
MIVLQKTCNACPEQYDAFVDDTDGPQVGYLRLRWGHFTVRFPDAEGELIYEANVGADGWTGIFDEADNSERDYHLRFAVDAIEKRIKFGPSPQDKPAAPDVQYRVVD